MDLAITLAVILMLLFWPRRGALRYYLLLIVAAGTLLVALLFAPFLLLTPLFYVGLALLLVILTFRVITAGRKDGQS